MRSEIRVFCCILLISMVIVYSAKGEHSVVDANNLDSVTMSLTHFSVSDANLQIGLKIINNTDQDLWICESLTPSGNVCESYLLEDNQTFVIRKRFGLPMKKRYLMEYPPLTSLYKRLSPGQKKEDLIILPLPLFSHRISEGSIGTADAAKQLTVEIGYYSDDLPELIYQIVDIAERLNLDTSVRFPNPEEQELVFKYFGGFAIASAYVNLPDFRSLVDAAASGGNELKLRYVGQGIDGEKSASITVDGVFLPIK